MSPLLCNVYLHRLDRAWDDGDGVLVRFADDVVVMCWSRGQAERALARLVELLAVLVTVPAPTKHNRRPAHRHRRWRHTRSVVVTLDGAQHPVVRAWTSWGSTTGWRGQSSAEGDSR